MLVIFLMAVTKSLTSSAREGGFILVPVEGLRFHQGGEDMAEEGKRPITLHTQSLSRSWTGNGIGLQNLRAHPIEPLPPSVLYLPKLPQPSWTVPPVGDQVFKHMCQKGIDHVQTMAVDTKECSGVLCLILKVTHEILFSLNMNKAVS